MTQENLDLEEEAQAAPEYWYRYNDYYYSNGEFSPTEVCISLEKYKVVKRTPTGVQLDLHGKLKFVQEDTRKAFARPDKDRAFTDFKARKRMQLKHLQIQASKVELAIARAAGGAEVYAPSAPDEQTARKK
jgi:hypothetical protein